jgi:hypothetical protein
MKTMRKCNDEIYQLANDKALVKKLKKTKDLGLLVHSVCGMVWSSCVEVDLCIFLNCLSISVLLYIQLLRGG